MNFLRAIGNMLRFDRANWKAVMLCFFAALVFWLFNAFNKNYAANIRFPLRFEYNQWAYFSITFSKRKIFQINHYFETMKIFFMVSKFRSTSPYAHGSTAKATSPPAGPTCQRR